MQGYGCDCMAEDGSILILADSLASTQQVPTEVRGGQSVVVV